MIIASFKFNKINDYWSPKIIGELNGQLVKLAKISGEFVWHSHEKEDELFMVIKGKLFMEFRDRTEIVSQGEIIIVPKGIEHRPRTENEVEGCRIQPGVVCGKGGTPSHDVGLACRPRWNLDRQRVG